LDQNLLFVWNARQFTLSTQMGKSMTHWEGCHLIRGPGVLPWYFLNEVNENWRFASALGKPFFFDVARIVKKLYQKHSRFAQARLTRHLRRRSQRSAGWLTNCPSPPHCIFKVLSWIIYRTC